MSGVGLDSSPRNGDNAPRPSTRRFARSAHFARRRSSSPPYPSPRARAAAAAAALPGVRRVRHVSDGGPAAAAHPRRGERVETDEPSPDDDADDDADDDVEADVDDDVDDALGSSERSTTGGDGRDGSREVRTRRAASASAAARMISALVDVVAPPPFRPSPPPAPNPPPTSPPAASPPTTTRPVAFGTLANIGSRGADLRTASVANSPSLESSSRTIRSRHARAADLAP